MKYLESKVNCFDALDLHFFPYISYSNCGVGFAPNPMGCTTDNNIFGLYNFLLCLVLIAFNICTTGNLFINFNRPFPSFKKSHFQNEAKCETFVVKMSFICIIEIIFISMASHLAPF